MEYSTGNCITSYNGTDTVTDADGNLVQAYTESGQKEYVYDSRNRLVKTSSSQYTYDDENYRIKSNAEEYCYDSKILQPGTKEIHKRRQRNRQSLKNTKS